LTLVQTVIFGAVAAAPPHQGDREQTPFVGRLERPALTGVLVREVVNFSSFWRSTTFSATVEPTIYLLAFGFGFGSLVSRVAGYDYVQFVGTGTVATAVLFSSVFPAMFGTFVKYQFQRTYDAILAAPVDTEELVTGEALWIAARAGTSVSQLAAANGCKYFGGSGQAMAERKQQHHDHPKEDIALRWKAGPTQGSRSRVQPTWMVGLNIP